MTSKDFRNRLQKIIDKYDGRKAFASAIDAPYSTVSEWIKRGSFPSEEHLASIARSGEDLDWLLTGKESRVGNAHHVAEEMAEYGPRRYPEDIEFVAMVLDDLRLRDKQRFDAAKEAIDGLFKACARDAKEAVEAKKMPRSKSKKAAA